MSLSLRQDHCVVFLDKARKVPFRMPLSTQLFKWGTGTFNAGGYLVMDYHPIQGEGVDILLVA